MLVSEVKRIGKVGRKFLENESADTIIRKIVELPLQKACIDFKNKNIETSMSSANRNNIMKNKNKIVQKQNVLEGIKNHKIQTFLKAGKGYAWIMLNYNTLSQDNKKLTYDLEKELGEDSIWFVKSNYVDSMNSLRRKFKIKEIQETFNDKYAEEFKKRQLLLMYNNKYPNRAVFIRMPIDSNTTISDVENYFSTITSKFYNQ